MTRSSSCLSNISRKLALNPEDDSQTVPPLHSPVTQTTDIQLVMSVEPNTAIDSTVLPQPPTPEGVHGSGKAVGM